MNFRLATEADLSEILTIIAAAKQFLKQQGSPQWQNGQGPDKAVIQKDIARQESYVLESAGQLVGTAALIKGNDPVYQAITGKWLRDSPDYLSIHHVAISPSVRGQGVGSKLLTVCLTEAQRLGYPDIRIDTYPANEIMRHLIKKAGFAECGIVQFPFPNGERVAYQFLGLDE
ncbi:GNAT family N-acetyltransferase [Enterococcus sp. CSURQ0835]|uniref:GNAT family N-acetyltransferase n=1 Tax=Enterococcus sp. CSURQ0835 TaxID=2681394 RepID=UPI00135695B6|nr:GNAT family N-acetyltransferase [Enterococcus sp. CSURQ0835]